MATSFESLLWSNIVAAFAGSSTEALGAAIVNVSCLLRLRDLSAGEGLVGPFALMMVLQCFILVFDTDHVL
jgi:hypothetical protein